MEFFQYLVIGARVLFFISLIWLINLTGNLDCLKNSSQVKSPYHCLSIFVEKSDKILQASRQTVRNSQHHQVQTSCAGSQVQPTQVSSASKPRQLRPYSQKDISIYCTEKYLPLSQFQPINGMAYFLIFLCCILSSVNGYSLKINPHIQTAVNTLQAKGQNNTLSFSQISNSTILNAIPSQIHASHQNELISFSVILSLEPGPFEVNILGPGKIEPIP